MAISRQIKARYETRNHEIVARLREAAGAGPPINREMRVKRLVAEIATEMALLHGGDWRVQYQPDRGVIVVARRLRSQP